MRSLRVRLALSVITVAVLLIGLLAALLYREVSSQIRADFDRRLVEDAHVLGDLVEFDVEDGLELEFGPVLASFDRQRSAKTWWRLWRPDGTVLVGGPDAEFLQGAPQGLEPVLTDEEHAHARLRRVDGRFSPRIDAEDPPADLDAVPMLGLTIARDTHEVDELLDDLARLFWLLGTLACLLVGGVAAWQVARGFVPVRRLATELSSLRPHELGGPLDTTGLPVELLPFVSRLNTLLERLQGALEREREFSGHVAHELRTPLAVLRTGLDLARRGEPAGSDAHAHLGELLDTVDDMGKMVDNLLMLARVERGADTTQLRAVELRPLVEGVWRSLAASAERRGLRFDDRVPEGHHVQADPGKLHIVLQNLLGNAVSYTERGGSIAVEAGPGQVLSVWDSGPQLDAEHLERVFDRMWRADLARTDAVQHAGLGLSLAQALCRHMKLELTAHNEDDGGLRFVVAAREP
ncbi:MAG: sensor histidine kinase N-terminal domain-containing protein [Myxococcales bacterium]|nr:sensor histidine kinase N-terminal domain-containing protein [Myxococcales bacterium]